MVRVGPLVIFIGALVASVAHGEEVDIDAEPTFDGIANAIVKARSAVADGHSVVVRLPSGSHNINMTDTLFDVSNLQAAPGGHITFAGRGMDQTTLVLNTHGYNVIEGKTKWGGITWRDFTFDRVGRSTTQASVVKVNGNELELQIESGYPAIEALLANNRIPRVKPEQGLYLRRFRRTQGECEIVVDKNHGTKWPPVANAQVRFECGGDGEHCPDIVALGSNRYKLQVVWSDHKELARYKSAVGTQQRIAIKVKHDGQAYYLRGGNDVSFIGVRWLQHSRGIILDTPNVLFRDTRVDRQSAPAGSALEPCLATNGGGPQVNGENAGGVHNVTFENHTSAGTGDDSIAMFGVLSGSVRSSTISDSFARGILLQDSPNVVVSADTVVNRCPILRSNSVVASFV